MSYEATYTNVHLAKSLKNSAVAYPSIATANELGDTEAMDKRELLE